MSEVEPATAAAPMPLSFAAVAAKSAANAPAATAPSAEQNSAGGSGEGAANANAAPAGGGRPAPQAAPDKAGAGAASSSSDSAKPTELTPVLSNGTSAPAAAVIGGGPNNDMAAQPQSQAAAAVVLPQDLPVGTVLNGTVLNGTSVNGVQGQWGGVPLGHIVTMGGSPVIVGASPYLPVDPAQMQAQMQAAAVNAQQHGTHAAAAVAVVATPDASPTLNGAEGPSNDAENKAPGANYQQNQQQHPEPRCSDVKLFVGQVPRTCDEPDLIPIFSRYGPLTDVSVIRHKYDGTHRGCAFVTYQYPQDAAVALREVHDRAQMGPRAKRCLQVRYASEPGQYVPRNPYGGGGGGNHQHQHHHQNGGGYPPQHHQNGYHQQGQQQQFDPGK